MAEVISLVCFICILLLCAMYHVHCRFRPGFSGLVVACLPAAREVPGLNHAVDNQVSIFYTKITAIHSLSTGCTLTAVPRSTQPSTLPETVN